MPWSRVNTEYSIHWVLHTPSTAYTAYYLHRVLHHPKIDCLPLPASLSSLGRPCCTQFSTFAQLRVNQWIESQFPSRFSPELPPLEWPPPGTRPISAIMASKCISKLARSQPASVSPNSHDYGLQVRTITASRCISKLTRSRPPSASPNSLDHSLQVYLQTRTITDSKCISKLTRSRPPSASPNSLDYTLQVYLQTRSITASECISKFHSNTVWWNGGARRKTAHHQHSAAPRTVSEWNSWEKAALARGPYEEGERIWRDTRPWWTTQIAWINEARQECMRLKAGKDRVCISYNEMMSIYPRVSQIYTACRWVHLRYPWISGCINIARLR